MVTIVTCIVTEVGITNQASPVWFTGNIQSLDSSAPKINKANKSKNWINKQNQMATLKFRALCRCPKKAFAEVGGIHLVERPASVNLNSAKKANKTIRSLRTVLERTAQQCSVLINTHSRINRLCSDVSAAYCLVAKWTSKPEAQAAVLRK